MVKTVKRVNKFRSARRHSRNRAFTGRCVTSEGTANNTNSCDVLCDPPLSSVTASTSGSSASARKLTSNVNDLNDNYEEVEHGYAFVDIDTFSAALLSIVVCGQCGLSVRFVEETRNGLARNFIIKCTSCSWKHSLQTNKLVNNESGTYEVNNRAIYAFRQLGSGYNSINNFCTYMNMPHMSTNCYYKHIHNIHHSCMKIAKQSMSQCAEEIRNRSDHPQTHTETAVSVDGTWQKRGYSSLNGVVTVLNMPDDNDSVGKVLDVEILTKTCKSCDIWNKRDKNSEEYTNWKELHNCNINHQGSAGSMETSGTKSIFQRSEKLHKLQYTEYYGDGDSKSFTEVANLNIYSGKNISKRECVGHVQKRVGSRLRRLKQMNKGIGGKGKLTDAKIDTLQNYFGFAIRGNKGDRKKMEKNIWAGLYHVASTDSKPQHKMCPKGPDSWCKYGQGTFKHKHGLPKDILEKMMPIYKDLTDKTLLQKCLHGKTQNQNESFHHLIWVRCPKEVFVGRDILEMSVYDAVIAFNEGAIGQIRVLRSLGITPGYWSLEGCRKSDMCRIKHAEIKSSVPIKKRRKVLRAQRKGKQDWYSNNESVQYAAGEF